MAEELLKTESLLDYTWHTSQTESKQKHSIYLKDIKVLLQMNTELFIQWVSHEVISSLVPILRDKFPQDIKLL